MVKYLGEWGGQWNEDTGEEDKILGKPLKGK